MLALDVHWPNQQSVQFQAHDAIADALHKATETQLTAYFRANAADVPSNEVGKTARDYS